MFFCCIYCHSHCLTVCLVVLFTRCGLTVFISSVKFILRGISLVLYKSMVFLIAFNISRILSFLSLVFINVKKDLRSFILAAFKSTKPTYFGNPINRILFCFPLMFLRRFELSPTMLVTYNCTDTSWREYQIQVHNSLYKQFYEMRLLIQSFLI